jgi:MFS transporter, MHS family, shikimate and dehydroshikimate transport protein
MSAHDSAMKSNSVLVTFFASAVGNAFEQYDFLLYGTASALFFNKLFFPATDPALGTIAVIGIFAVGYCARPVGGLIFAHLGDRVGRRSTLLVTFLITGSATVLIGLLPTYQDVGIWAPIGLTVLRLLQGVGIGGEHSGASIIAVENAPTARRGLWGVWPGIGTYIGLLTSASAFTVAALISGDAFLIWGWRLPFLVSILLLGLGTVIRLRLTESPAFEAASRRRELVRFPLVTVLTEYPRTALTAAICRIGELGWGMLVTIIGAGYIVGQLHLPRAVFLSGFEIAATVGLVLLPVYGLLGDKFGRKRIYMLGNLLAMAFAFPLFWLLQTRDPLLITLALVISNGIIQAMLIGLQPSFLGELFEARVRYSGLALGQQVGAAIGGGILPVFWTSLMGSEAGGPWPVCLSMCVLSGVVIVAVRMMPDRQCIDLGADPSVWREKSTDTVPIVAADPSLL